MRFGRLLLVTLVLCGAAVATAGDIQVFCSPGARVYLDGELAGLCNRLDDGAYLMGVAPGTHTLRVEQDGFVPKSFEVSVGQVPVEVTVGVLEPAPKALPDTAPQDPGAPLAVGSLVVTSAPQNCVVEVDGEPRTKTTPQLTIGGLAAGEHTVTFRKPGYEPVSELVTVHPGASVSVRGNLKAAEVETAHEGQGSLRLYSTPTRCTVRILGMVNEKTDRVLNVTRLPAGEYPVVVSIPGRELSGRVLIADGQRTIVKVSFMAGDEPFVVSRVPE